MNLTTKGRYSVMAMVDLALNDKGQPVSLSEIAQRQNIALSYLEQIFNRLRKAGLVVSVRGPGGGYKVAKFFGEVKISEIVLAVEESIKMTRCSDGSDGCMSDKTKCVTHNLWEGLGNQINGYLESITLQDVCLKNIPLANNGCTAGSYANG